MRSYVNRLLGACVTGAVLTVGGTVGGGVSGGETLNPQKARGVGLVSRACG